MPTTTNYTYNLPIVGGDFELWGDLLNANTEKLDDDLKAANDAIDAVETSVASVASSVGDCVLKAGSVMTGMLTLPAAEPVNNLYATKKQYVDNGELSQASRYLFSTGLTDADPGSGKIGYSTATASTNARDAIRIYISTSCTNGKTTPNIVNFVDGVVVGLSSSTRTIYYRITSAANNGAWYTLTVVALGTGITFPAPAADAAMLLTFLGYLEPEEAPVAPYTDHTIATWAYQNTYPVAHGLGHVPSDVRVVFKCMTTQSSWVSGDYVFTAVGANNTQSGYTIGADATNVRFTTGDKIMLIPRGGDESCVTMTPGNWDIILRVWP